MILSRTREENSNNGIVLSIISSIIISTFLFYIDEGYYNFQWMSESGNWIAFFVYVILIFSGQLLFTNLTRLTRRKSEIQSMYKPVLIFSIMITSFFILFGSFTNW